MYLLQYSLLLISSVFDKKYYSKLLIFLNISLIVIVAGSRYEIGGDYDAYLNAPLEAFEYLKYGISSDRIATWGEPISLGIYLLSWVLNKYQLVFVIFALISALSLIKISRYMQSPGLFLLAYFSISFFAYQMHYIRMGSAALILLLSLIMHHYERQIKSISLIFVAQAIHSWSVLFVLLFVFSERLNLKTLISILACTIILRYSGHSFELIILERLYSITPEWFPIHYLLRDLDVRYGVDNIYYFHLILVGIFLSLMYFSPEKISNSRLYYSQLRLYILSLIIGLSMQSFDLIGRISSVLFLLIPVLIGEVRFDRSYAGFLLRIIFAFLLSIHFMWYIYVNQYNMNLYHPYKSTIF